MKDIFVRRCLYIFVTFLLSLGTKVSGEGRIIQSEPSSNIAAFVYADVFCTSTNVIGYGFLNTGTNHMTVYIAPDGQTLCKLEMVNANGEKVRKTKIALKEESLFFEGTAFDWNKTKKKTGWSQLRPYTLPAGEGGSIFPFHTPEQLFVMEKPGKYVLSISFQVIFRNRIVTLPPVKLEITKPTNTDASNPNGG